MGKRQYNGANRIKCIGLCVTNLLLIGADLLGFIRILILNFFDSIGIFRGLKTEKIMVSEPGKKLPGICE